MRTAVIVPSVIGRQSMLDRCLASLAATNGPPDAVFVAFQGPEDRTVTAAVRAAHPDVHVLWSPRRGASAARNAGAARASADLLLFVDDDCVVDPDWLQRYRAAFAAEPELMAAGGQVLPTGTLGVQGAPLGLKFAGEAKIYEGRQNPIGTIDRGGNLAVRPHAFAAAGGFDERLGPGTPTRSCEDVDIAYRLLRRGYRLRYVPDAVVFHDQWRTTEEAIAVETGYGFGMGAFLGKQFRAGDLYAAWLLFWVYGVWGVRPFVGGLRRRSASETRHGRLHLLAIPRGLWYALRRFPSNQPPPVIATATTDTAASAT